MKIWLPRCVFVVGFMSVWQLGLSRDVAAQSGLRESLERLDRDGDGDIEPNEITPMARPYLERVAEVQRLDLNRDNSIEKWQEAARVYYALKNGVAAKSIVPSVDATVMEFGPKPDEPLVPEFGLAQVRYPYTPSDLVEADAQLRRADRNKDGYIDRIEAVEVKWTHRDPFEEDIDHDGRLSRLELAQRYARRRLVSDDADELVQKAKRSGSGVRPVDSRASSSRGDSRSRYDNVHYYLTVNVMSRFDIDRNGKLDAEEALNLGLPTPRIDLNLDGELSREEVHLYLAELQNEAGIDEKGLPGWFYERDADRDGQVSMAEFTDDWTEDKVEEFSSLDANRDGMLTTMELIQSKAMIGGSYASSGAEVLPPHKTIISEIVVDDDFLIRDLNVQLSITHSNAVDLDVYLIGPNGQRIELFTAVGGSENHFDSTILDDQASESITKSRPPFKGSFIPEGLINGQEGLSYFNGKSTKGPWQLIVSATRSERFGMLHNWGLIVKPQ